MAGYQTRTSWGGIPWERHTWNMTRAQCVACGALAIEVMVSGKVRCLGRPAEKMPRFDECGQPQR